MSEEEDALVEAHIAGQTAIRAALLIALARIWSSLGSYNREDVPKWLAGALPLIETAQRQSVALTNAYLSRVLDRPPLPLDLHDLIGAEVRNGVTPQEVYERPFVTIWADLKQGTEWEKAVANGLDRVESVAATDVQLSMRAAADAIDRLDSSFFGFERVANPDACSFCKEVNGAYVKGSDGFVMALHNRCGCGLRALKEPHDLARLLPDGTPADDEERKRLGYPALADMRVAVREHGELGPVLVDPAHDFTSEADLAHAH